MFLPRNLKNLYEFTVIPRFKLQLVPKKKGDVNRMTMQIEVRGNKKVDDVNRNNVNRFDVNLSITVLYDLYTRMMMYSIVLDCNKDFLMKHTFIRVYFSHFNFLISLYI